MKNEGIIYNYIIALKALSCLAFGLEGSWQFHTMDGCIDDDGVIIYLDVIRLEQTN